MDNKPADKKPMVIGPDGQPLKADNSLALAIEKFRQPDKHYRLIWTRFGKAWLAVENKTHFRTKFGEGGIVAAGAALAQKFGVKFSEVTR